MDDKATGTMVVHSPDLVSIILLSIDHISELLFLFLNRSLLSSPFRNQHPKWRSLSLEIEKLLWKRLRNA